LFRIASWYPWPPFELTSVTQLPWFLFLGILTGAMGAAFLRLLNRTEALFDKLRAPIHWRLALGGLVVGLIALEFPGVWGNGYVVTNRMLHYGSSAFSPGEIISLESFVAKLKQPSDSDGVSQYLAGQLSAATKDLLSDDSGGLDARLRQALIEDLNRVIRHGP